jgi:hypothetical protein
MVRSRHSLFGFIATAVILVPISIIPARADNYSTGFESPAYSTGVLAGQNGWLEFGSTIATVENFFAYAGSQAVFVNGGNAGGQSGPYYADSTPDVGPLIDLSAELYIASSSSESEWQFAATGPGLVGFIGGINLLPGTGTADSIELITGTNPIIGATFALNTWNNVNLLFNMTAQTYALSLNGSVLQSGIAFCGSNGACTGASVPTYGDSLFDTFGGANNDAGYMDNFSVADVSVPEPGSMVLLASVTMMLFGYGWHRRRGRV